LRAELERELGDRGRFLGFVSAQDKAQLISGATILTDRNPVALGNAIAALLEDDPRRTRMALAGRARATANYHYPSLVNELVSWLQQVTPVT
jgi:glycosyltransferase involved in cell wall biosynthesis